MRRGTAPVLLLLLAALTAVAQTPEAEFLPERQATCYDCHAGDAVPLRTLYAVVPPPVETDAPVFSYTVEVRNTWLHDQRYLGPRLDLTDAPSLRFADDRAPIDATQDGTVDTTPRAPAPPSGAQVLPDPSPTLAPHAGHVVVTVPAGATAVTLRLEETSDLADPEVTWNLYTGRSAPEGEPDRTTTSTPGAPAELRLEGPDDFQGIAYGNWTVEAQVPAAAASATDPDAQPTPGDLPFRVHLHAAFGSAEDRVSQLGRQLQLDPGQSTLFTWTLARAGDAPPGPDETVRLDVDGSAFYEHQTAQGADDDWAHVTKGLELSVGPGAAPGALRIGRGDEALLVVAVPAAPGTALVPVLEIVGYVGAFLVAASMVSGGVFGKASRRHLNRLFGTARRRVAFHNALSYGLLLVATFHSVVFFLDNLGGGLFHWSLGLIWGGAALLALVGLGVTGVLQVPLIRRWNYATWRWVHLGLALAALLFTAVHLLLDGAHFTAVQDWLGYRNPLDPRLD